MANDLLCIHCGYQEGYHRLRDQYNLKQAEEASKKLQGHNHSLMSCPGFEDGIEHEEGCPGSPDCTGNCKETIAQKRREFEKKYKQHWGYGD